MLGINKGSILLLMAHYIVTLECGVPSVLFVCGCTRDKGVHGCPKSKQATAARWKRCIGVLCQTRTQAPPKVSFEYGACG